MASGVTTAPPDSPRLGCIADDFTGATDLASNLTAGGMRVVQTMGVDPNLVVEHADAVVVALKSRTLEPSEAIRQSLQALRWLQGLGVEQVYFKYCSTFDSIYAGERRGNIGPVIDALMVAMQCDFTVATPAFPANGRTVYKGHLFVGDDLLSESGMRDHPLTPMRDANLVRVLQAQSQSKVGLLDSSVVRQGPAAIQLGLAELRAQGVRIAIVDAIDNEDLQALGQAVATLPLVTAGSGLALGLPPNFGVTPSAVGNRLPPASGYRAVVSGSCSVATNAQVADFLERGYAAYRLDPERLLNGEPVVEEALHWASTALGEKPVLVYSTASVDQVQQTQSQGGVQQAGALLETALARIACGLVALGVRQLLVAGGETSGACAKALNVHTMEVGPAVAPGVPWCFVPSAPDRPALHLLLKSGNFGAVDIFSAGFEVIA
jgi:3-dehydrotetronate 4-kinase